MNVSIVFLLFLFLCIRGELFINICESSSGHHCCSPGMESSEYWIMKHTGTWSNLEIECRLESDPYSHLVILDNRGENDCLIKYLTDEYGDAQKRFAIGLKSLDEYRGVYEWRGTDATPEFTNWATNYPRDNPYDNNLYGICERTK
jgi:hypothetical protein